MIGKLGKLPRQPDDRNLRLARYIDAGRLPPVPLFKAWSPAVGHYSLAANDHVGCCTISAAAHAISTWTANNHRPLVVSDADVLAAYSAVSGWTPQDPESDRGATMLAALKHWRTHGIGGHRILAFAEIDPQDHATIMHAVRLFGGVYLGLLLPTCARTEDVWSCTWGRPQSWGGHAVWAPNYSPHTRDCVTWGHVQRMTPEFLDRYCDEAYAIISEQWLGPDLVAPNGFRLAELVRDLESVTK